MKKTWILFCVLLSCTLFVLPIKSVLAVTYDPQTLCGSAPKISSCPDGSLPTSLTNGTIDSTNFAQYKTLKGCIDSGYPKFLGCTVDTICCGAYVNTNTCISLNGTCVGSKKGCPKNSSTNTSATCSGANIDTAAEGDPICCVPNSVAPEKTTPAAVAPKKTTPAAVAPTSYNLYNPLGEVKDLTVIMGKIISMFLGIVGALALLAFVYGGIMWMTARGDANWLKKGQSTLTSAAWGLVIIGFAYTLTSSFLKLWSSSPATLTTNPARTSGQAATTAEAQQDTLIQAQAAAALAAAASANPTSMVNTSGGTVGTGAGTSDVGSSNAGQSNTGNATIDQCINAGYSMSYCQTLGGTASQTDLCKQKGPAWVCQVGTPVATDFYCLPTGWSYSQLCKYSNTASDAQQPRCCCNKKYPIGLPTGNKVPQTDAKGNPVHVKDANGNDTSQVIYIPELYTSPNNNCPP